MLSLEQLTNPPTRSEAAQWLKDTLTELGFSTTGWQESRIQLQLLNAFASTVSGAGSLIAAFAQLGFNETASGSGLTLFSRSRFSNERNAAVKTAGPFTFTNDSTSPQTVNPGDIIVTDPTGVQFVNTAPGTIPAGGNVQIDMEAILAGLDGNVGNESTLSLVTPIAGVTVTNPSPGTDIDGNDLPWYTTVGADPETDRELRERNESKWGLLAVEKTSTAVLNLALEQTGVAKAKVVANNPRGPYTVDVYVAGETTVIGTGDLEDAQNAFAELTFGTETYPVTDFPLPSAYRLYQTPTQVLTLIGDVYYDPAFSETEVTNELNARLLAFLVSIPIGGFDFTSTLTNVITLGDITQVIEGTTGVRSVTMSNPAGNIAVPTTVLMTEPTGGWVDVGKLELIKVTQ